MKTRLYLTALMLLAVACLPSLQAQSWLNNGNGNTTVGTNFLSTTNSQSLGVQNQQHRTNAPD